MADHVRASYLSTPSSLAGPRLPLLFDSHTYKWLPLRPRALVVISGPKLGVVLGRNANFLMISARHLEREPHCTRPNGTCRHHLSLPRLEHARQGTGTLHRGPVTSIGPQVNATAGLTVHLSTKRIPTQKITPLALPMKSKTRKTL